MLRPAVVWGAIAITLRLEGGEQLTALRRGGARVNVIRLLIVREDVIMSLLCADS